MKSNCFYYGVFTADGFRSLATDSALPSERNLIVNGQSPAVKQELFDFIKQRLKQRKISYTDLCSSSGSIGLHCEKFKIVDGEFSTFSVENFTPIYLENFQKEQQNPKEIFEKREKNILRAKRFLSACNCIKDDIIRLEEPYINHTKINGFTRRLWQKISGEMKGRIGTESIRSITCLTADGSELNMEAFDIYCNKVLVISDSSGAVSRIIVDRLRRYALGSGYDVISCQCALGETEHIIIPELKYGVFSSRYYHRSDFRNERKIYAKRFLFPSADSIKIRTDFSLKAYRAMMNEVFVSLREVEKCDKILDLIYYNSTDMEQLKTSVEQILFAP